MRPASLWALLILLIKEPPRRVAVEAPTPQPRARANLWRIAPVYFVVATASLVDNAVGAWAPSLLIRGFGLDPARWACSSACC